MARWFHWLPQGALLVIDEGQKIYPTRLKNLKEFDFYTDEESEQWRPKTLEEAFDQHRHFNWDIYINNKYCKNT